MSGTIKSIIMVWFVMGFPHGSFAQGVVQEKAGTTKDSISGAYDCTKIEIEIDKRSGPSTAAERAAAMDKAFYESLSKFDRCNTARLTNDGPNSGQESGGKESGSGSGAGTIESVASQSIQGEKAEEGKADADAIQSVASQSVKGTLTKENDKADSDAQTDGEKEKELTSVKSVEASGIGSGKLPDDIPPVDNDSVLEKQIRIAATAEKDPAIKAKLWNEYRKYKGLPLVKTGK